jgi:hypothetical protein
VALLHAAWTSSRMEHAPLLEQQAGSQTEMCTWSGGAANVKTVLYGNGTTDRPGRCELSVHMDDRWCMFTEALRIVGNVDAWLRHIVADTYFGGRQDGRLLFAQELPITDEHRDQMQCYNMAVETIKLAIKEK